MTSKQYIVKNCPCLFNSYYASGKTVRFECNDGNHDDKLCRDVTDCVIKQIITICKWDKMSKEDMKRSKDVADIIRGSKYGRDALAIQILQLFDIEEIK